MLTLYDTKEGKVFFIEHKVELYHLPLPTHSAKCVCQVMYDRTPIRTFENEQDAIKLMVKINEAFMGCSFRMTI